MKQQIHIVKHLFVLCAAMLLMFGFCATQAKAAELSANVSVNRTAGECTYTVQGLDYTSTSKLSLQVLHKDTQASAFQKEITLTQANCANGTFSDSFSLQSVNNSYDNYMVKIVYGANTIDAGSCDFSIHTSKLGMSVTGNNGSSSRSVTLTSSEAAGDVAIPGTDKQITILAWPEKSAETSAKSIVAKTAFTEGGMTLNADLSQAGSAYGTWNAKVVLDSTSTTLASATYTVAPTQTALVIKNTKALEKKASFGVSLEGLKNVYGMKKVTFRIYNSKGKKVASIAGTKKKADGSKYYAAVTMKSLGYALDTYTVKAVLTDNNGSTQILNIAAIADKRAQSGTLSVTRKNNATCVFKLNNAYLPGYIKKVQFVLYEIEGKKLDRQGSYIVKNTAGKNETSTKVHNDAVGKFKICAYGYTSWGKRVLLNQNTYRLTKKHLGKNGWFYKKYAGKKYKFYYVNNIKQTDLTKVLNLKKSSSSNTNKFYIEINRAASAVTIYMYNEETKKYDIPIKTCSVSVGADIWTNAGTGGLHEKSSYTPIGTYSICSNGQSVKYTLKPMHEPDGSTVYARWASHIVGNVYFHSIAVGGQSHYSLPSSTYNRLGSPASAGCIRMTVADAKWIYDYASTGTTVKIVVGNSKKPGPLGKSPVIKTTSGINYDPTDPAVPDSRKKKDYKAKKITGYMTKSGKKVGY